MYKITLQEIEYFLTSAEHLNFTEAALAVYTSQSAISKCIQRVEKELNLKLFNRDNRGVSLTPEGELIYEKWRFLYDGILETVDSARSISPEHKKKLHIGCLTNFENLTCIRDFIQTYEVQNPGVSVELHVLGLKDLRESLLSGYCDVIISFNGELSPIKDICLKPLMHIKNYIALSSKHKLANISNLKLHDLQSETFYLISPSEAKISAANILESLKQIEFRPRQIEYIPNISSLAFAVSQGKGIAICNSLITKGYENEITLVPFNELFTNTYLAVAWQEKSISVELQKLIDLI